MNKQFILEILIRELRVCPGGDRPRNGGGRRFKASVPNHLWKGTDSSKEWTTDRQNWILAHFGLLLTDRQTKML